MMSSTLAGAFTSDDWLSSVLGVPSFNGNVRLAQHDDAAVAIPTGFCSTKIDTSAPETPVVSQMLSEANFRLVTVECSFRGWVMDEAQGKSRPIGYARAAVAADLVSIKGLAAAAFHSDRFHRDPMISTETADRLKAEWAGNFFVGKRGTDLFVWEVEGRIAAFLLAAVTPDEFLIDLIAVDARNRGEGIAKELVRQMIEQTSDPSVLVRVGTQVDNLSSIRTYLALGLKFAGSRYVFHRMVMPE